MVPLTTQNAILPVMHLLRTGLAARTIAVFFLLWTGADLINPGLCAIDRDSESFGRPAAIVAATSDSPQQAPANGAEDCFCCCQHVVSVATWIPIPQVQIEERLALLPSAHVRVFHTRFDHPPRFV